MLFVAVPTYTPNHTNNSRYSSVFVVVNGVDSLNGTMVPLPKSTVEFKAVSNAVTISAAVMGALMRAVSGPAPIRVYA